MNSILRRIGAKHGLHGYNLRVHNNEPVPGVEDLLPWGEPGLWASHNERKDLDGAIQQVRHAKFILTVVRDPVERCMSHFYFRARKHHDLLDWRGKLDWLNGSHCQNYQLNYIAPPGWNATAHAHNRSDIVQMLHENYDFVGVDSMMNETAVLLAHRLNANLDDVLFLSGKVSSSGDEKGGYRLINHPPLSEEPWQVQQFVASEEFKSRNVGDETLVEIATTRIKARLSYDDFIRAKLHKYSVMLDRATKVCEERRLVDECYTGDQGCGFQCLDMLANGTLHYDENRSNWIPWRDLELPSQASERLDALARPRAPVA
jgi:hypothetical protein